MTTYHLSVHKNCPSYHGMETPTALGKSSWMTSKILPLLHSYARIERIWLDSGNKQYYRFALIEPLMYFSLL